MRLLLLGLFLLLLMLQYRLWFADGSLAERARLQEEVSRQEVRNAELRSRNEVIEREVVELKTGQEGLEQRAREQLGLVREGEVYYQFLPEAETPEDPPADD